MTGTSLIDLGKLAKPATTLIEKVSDAVGGLARPWQTERVAKAESKAAVIKAQAEIVITDLQRRALTRLANEEAQKQQNMESIAYKAIDYLTDNSTPEKIDPDWITYTFERCRNVSNIEIQTIWAKILANEANEPGTVTKTTIDSLSKIDNKIASIFEKLTSSIFTITDEENKEPAIVNYRGHQYFDKNFLKFDDFQLLAEVGLLTISTSSLGHSYCIKANSQNPIVFYGDTKIEITLKENTTITTGNMILTAAGTNLFEALGGRTDSELLQAVIECWTKFGYSPKITSI